MLSMNCAVLSDITWRCIMKKRIAAIVLCVFCLLAIAGCSQSKPDAQTAQPTAAQETGDYLTTISGTYEELFPQLAKAEYRDL